MGIASSLSVEHLIDFNPALKPETVIKGRLSVVVIHMEIIKRLLHNERN